MAHIEPWQTQPESYPFSYEADTRFQDIDIHNHINNVAMAALMESGRMRFYQKLTDMLPELGYRLLIAAVNINYLRETSFPQPVTITCGIIRVNNSSWNLAQAVYQLQGGGNKAESVCVATGEVTTVLADQNGSTPVPDSIREMLLQDAIRS